MTFVRNHPKWLLVSLITLFLTATPLSSTLAQPQGPTQPGEYRLLAPLSPSLWYVPANNFSGYAQNMITLIIGFSAVLAVLMITFGGFMYMVGEAVHTKEEGKKYMTNAIYGLLLLLSIYLILYTINPQLLNLNLNLSAITPSGAANNNLSPTASNRARNNNPTNNNPTPTAPSPTSTPGPQNVTYFSPLYGAALTCTLCIPTSNLASGGIIVSQNACVQGRICTVEQGLAAKLDTLNSSAPDNIPPMIITEAWPPTVVHAAPCHQVGTCVDMGLGGGPNVYTATNINAFVAAAKEAGLSAVYEGPTVPDGAQNAVAIAGLPPHFSVYKTYDDCLKAGYKNALACP